MVSFNNLIIKIFKSHGFEINSSSDYSKYIFASKGNINLSVGYSDPEDESNLSKVRNFYRSAKRDSADMLIYVITNTTYPSEIDKFTNDRNIQLWNRVSDVTSFSGFLTDFFFGGAIVCFTPVAVFPVIASMSNAASFFVKAFVEAFVEFMRRVWL